MILFNREKIPELKKCILVFTCIIQKIFIFILAEHQVKFKKPDENYARGRNRSAFFKFFIAAHDTKIFSFIYTP